MKRWCPLCLPSAPSFGILTFRYKRSTYGLGKRIRNVLKHCEPTTGHLPYDKLKAIHVQVIQLVMNEPTKDRPAYANATSNRIIAMLKTMGQLAHRLDIVPVNEAMKIRLLREKNARTRFLDTDEMKAFVRLCDIGG